jgi:hypothetical protein
MTAGIADLSGLGRPHQQFSRATPRRVGWLLGHIISSLFQRP